MNSLRAHYIQSGAITPDQPTRWTSNKLTLSMNEYGREMALLHMAEDAFAAELGDLCEIPLDQVPEFVLEQWGMLDVY